MWIHLINNLSHATALGLALHNSGAQEALSTLNRFNFAVLENLQKIRK